MIFFINMQPGTIKICLCVFGFGFAFAFQCIRPLQPCASQPASQPLTKGRRIKIRKTAKEGNEVHFASDI